MSGGPESGRGGTPAAEDALLRAGSPRHQLRRLFSAALAGVDPERSVAAALSRPDGGRARGGARRVGVFAAGKAAAGMARAAVSRLGPVPLLVVLPRGRTRGMRLSSWSLHFASHPEPDASSATAARAAQRFFRRFRLSDVIVCLISGGASSLLALPRPGVTLAQKRRAVRELAASGAPIEKVNRLRTSLSAVKGGRLGRETRARLVNLVISDVSEDDPAVVGSGPTIRRRKTDLVHVIASNRDGLEAAASAARVMGLEPRIVPRPLSGDARDAGGRLGLRALGLPPGSVLLAGGETTVRLRGRASRGGRCLELALAAAEPLRGAGDILMLAAGSDGVDGSSGAAGAFVGGYTLARAASRGLERDRRLRLVDARALFLSLGDLFITGPTGTNVADWVFAIRSGPSRWWPRRKRHISRG